MASDLRLYWETLRRLEPEQLQHQMRVRLRRLVPSRPSGRISGRAGMGWEPRVSRCRMPLEPEVLRGRFRFWGRTFDIDLKQPWEVLAESRSWNYPVHYFDYLPPLADAAQIAGDVQAVRTLERFLDLWIEAHPTGRGVAWEPYPTALRIVNWLDVLATLGSLAELVWRERVLGSLWLQSDWLSRRLERHLLGTHLLKDTKALLWAGQVFGGPRAAVWKRDADALLLRELARQVRADGSHLEPSVMYHDLALEDVLDLLNLESAASRELRELAGATASRMLEFTNAVQTPAGEVPLLGDAGIGEVPSPRELLAYAARLGLSVPAAPESGLRLFGDAGVAVWRDAHQYGIADVGTIGPPHLAGHGHCDSLSFEWWVDGVPIVVDSGTASYETDAARQASRSTRAHNTLQIDAREQHEIWAAFRVARRAEVRAERTATNVIRAELVPWHDRGVRCAREFEWKAESIRIRDHVEGHGAHQIVSRLHLHPDCAVRIEGCVLHVQHGQAAARILLPESPRFDLVEPERSRSFYCERFGESRPSWELEARATELPFDCELSLLPGSHGPTV